MQAFINLFVKQFENGNLVIVLLISAIAFLFRYKQIIEFFDGRKKLKIEKFTNALKCEQLTGLTRAHIENELVNEHFRQATGLGVEKEFRGAILKLHNQMQGEVSFSHFRRALSHLYLENQTIVVRLTKLSLFSFWYNTAAGAILLAIGFFSIAIVVAAPFIQSNINAWSLLGFGSSFLITGIFMISLNRSIYSARIIKNQQTKIKPKSPYPH